MEDYKKEEIEVPKCPEDLDDIKGLDNTHPSGGIFALYTGDNSLFLKDLISNYFKSDKAGRFNLVLPREEMEALKQEPALVKLLNSKRVNIVYVETMPSVGRWMQDSFQFTTIDAKPALYQLTHGRESGQKIEMRLACKLARNCDIPYYIPPGMVNPYNIEENNLNSGGNLEVLPGGTFLSGVRKYSYGDEIKPLRTRFQNTQKYLLEKSGNRVLEIDTSFLRVGHVDEIFNFVKTDRPAPCDFAVMMASPEKAFELLEKAASSNVSIFNRINPLSFFIGPAYAGMRAAPSIPCSQYTERKLELRDINYPISENEIAKMKKYKCINGMTAQSFVRSRTYSIIKNRNMDAWGDSYTDWQISEDGEMKKVLVRRQGANHVLGANRELIAEELKKTTGCKNPPVIEIPVFFRNRLSFTPNLINGVVQTPPGGASSVILPQSYFAPFDEYVEKELSKYGVSTTYVHDLGYHLKHGEVHCGTNSARICRP